MKNITGQIWGIGVGPGDPDLMTLKAHRILQEADVVAFPAPAGSDSLVRSIAAPYIPGDAEEFVISTPMDVARHPAQKIRATCPRNAQFRSSTLPDFPAMYRHRIARHPA